MKVIQNSKFNPSTALKFNAERSQSVKTQNYRRGQVMILSVVMLGGILLSGSAIAGILMFYQIRAANDAVNSAKAVFAADAGIEGVTWCAFKGGGTCSADNPLDISFDDENVSVEINYNPDEDGNLIYILSKGYAAGGKIVRILETIFEAPSSQ
ncbi:MAG TPA: hypothetical protein VNK70_00840 [Candidatus Paceibacterota bacterium]|nr:hypothetical protein [Candidatus Paceibacterota bacterium]